jgi:hypothetical protein
MFCKYGLAPVLQNTQFFKAHFLGVSLAFSLEAVAVAGTVAFFIYKGTQYSKV